MNTPSIGPNHLTLFVPGRPAPQGSKRYLDNGQFVEGSPHVHAWRSDIRSAVLGRSGRLADRGSPMPADALKRPAEAGVKARDPLTPQGILDGSKPGAT
jgi:crossover junction endodeoxyribonuclease RusA